VWQSIGGQEIGSIWGHGAYVAPDWSADWLHRESVLILTAWAKQKGVASFEALGVDDQAVLKARLIREQRANTYNPETQTVTISAERAAAFQTLEAYYADIFGNGRSEYAIPKNALTDTAKQRQMLRSFGGRLGRPPPTALTAM
jgi:nitric oxide reductase subunit B